MGVSQTHPCMCSHRCEASQKNRCRQGETKAMDFYAEPPEAEESGAWDEGCAKNDLDVFACLKRLSHIPEGWVLLEDIVKNWSYL